MQIFAIFLFLFVIASHLVGCVVSAALPEGDGNGDVKVINLGTQSIEVLTLPEGFDMSHPALNITRLIEMRQEDPQAILPSLPDDIATTMVEVETQLFCETSDGSPNRNHILHNANTLYLIGDVFCCQNNFLPAKCTMMTDFISAATDICGGKGSCMKCFDAAQSNAMIASKCANGKKAGGYVRYVQLF
jgi:hypothetical protein